MPTSGMPWIKLYTEFLDDPKVGFVPELAQLLLMKLFLIAGECDAEGYLANGDDLLTKEHIAWRLRIPADDFVQRWDALEEAGFVCEEDDGALLVVKFQERQGRSQSQKREQWRERKARQRENQAGQASDSNESHAGVTRDADGSHAAREREEGEKEKELEKRTLQGADAPAVSSPPVPTCWDDWEEAYKTYANTPALIRRMVEILYPGLDPPDYGEIGGIAKRMGKGKAGFKRLMGLLWEYSKRPPDGDLLPYLLRVHLGKERDNGHDKPDVTSSEYRKARYMTDAAMPLESGDT